MNHTSGYTAISKLEVTARCNLMGELHGMYVNYITVKLLFKKRINLRLDRAVMKFQALKEDKQWLFISPGQSQETGQL